MKRPRMSIIAVLLLFGALATRAGAESDRIEGIHVTVTPTVIGFMDWDSHVNLDNSAVWGARVGLFPIPYVGVEGRIDWTRANTENGTTPWVQAGAAKSTTRTDVFDGGASLVGRIPTGTPITPYFLGGWHWARFDPKGARRVEEGGGEFGGGVMVALDPRMALRAEYRDIIWKFEEDPEKKDTNNALWTLGVQLTFGGHHRGGEGAGTYEHATLIEEAPAPAAPPRPAPPVPSPALADSDGDGVPDGSDRCPHTPAGARVDANGCPVAVSEKETELLDTGKITVRNIRFHPGSAELLPESLPAIDEIGTILTHWPELRIEIGGHADSQGGDEMNLALSKRRAQAVRARLEQRFPQLRAGQLTVHGYGETEPVATNDTAEGRALNRRVELKVLNTEVLKRERERRRG